MGISKVNRERANSFSDFVREFLDNKMLLFIIAKRDIRIKFSQTLIGLGWTLLQPLTGLVIYSLFFGSVLKWNTSNLPYPIYVLSGLIGWNYFVYIVNQGVFCIRENSDLIRNMHVPLIVFPFSKAIVGLIDLVAHIILFIPLIYFYDLTISWKIIFLPLVILYNTILGLSVSIFFLSFSIIKKDILHIIPYLITFGIWLTPVFFSRDVYPHPIDKIIEANPLTHIVGLWRWSLFGSGTFNIFWVYGFFLSTFFFMGVMGIFNRKQNILRDSL
jgi:lipopolysaccharide transport system permease protein